MNFVLFWRNLRSQCCMDQKQDPRVCDKAQLTHTVDSVHCASQRYNGYTPDKHGRAVHNDKNSLSHSEFLFYRKRVARPIRPRRSAQRGGSKVSSGALGGIGGGGGGRGAGPGPGARSGAGLAVVDGGEGEYRRWCPRTSCKGRRWRKL